MSGEVEAIVATALASAEPTVLDPGERYVLLDPQGGHHVIEPAADRYLPAPRRVWGTSVVYDVDSLRFLWEKHADPFSELFADPTAFSITGVLNADVGAGSAAGFRDHRVVFQSVLTPAWKAWAALDGQLVDQTKFAEHIEDRIIEVVEPSGADMLELAQTFEANTSVEFKQASILGSGQRGLHFVETISAKAGQSGQITIPETFVVALQPFEGGDAYRVKARLRYRIRNGSLSIGYKLERPEDVLREAFKDRMVAVSEATGQVVLVGCAPPVR